jgi:tRNA1Val (adenine37-N6)-methyltransferase
LCAAVELFPVKITRVKGSHKTQIIRSLLAFKRFEPPVLDANELVIEISRHEYTDEYVELVRGFYLKM